MKILIINSGSSSIKYQLFDTKTAKALCKGIVEKIGFGKNSISHHDAIKSIFAALNDKKSGVIKSYSEISGIGHRVVHGAEEFYQPTLINDKVIRTIEKFNSLAPLHNPPALLAIRACCKLVKHIPQVAVFDTAFHHTIPPKAYIYGIPYKFYKGLKIRRYGFHGTSHKFVAEKAALMLKKDLKKLKIITCHLGNGCSITAVKGARAIDTSMGFTPLEGLLMGTRCGDIDPAIVLYLMEKKNLSIKQMDNLLNKESGLLGLSGIGNDMRDIIKAKKTGNARANLAFEIFLYRIKKYIGAYTASMDGLDAVVLTAGIGENAPSIRKRILKDLSSFLHKFKARVLVVATNEELMIAQESARVILKTSKKDKRF